MARRRYAVNINMINYHVTVHSDLFAGIRKKCAAVLPVRTPLSPVMRFAPSRDADRALAAGCSLIQGVTGIRPAEFLTDFRKDSAIDRDIYVIRVAGRVNVVGGAAQIWVVFGLHPRPFAAAFA